MLGILANFKAVTSLQIDKLSKFKILSAAISYIVLLIEVNTSKNVLTSIVFSNTFAHRG